MPGPLVSSKGARARHPAGALPNNGAALEITCVRAARFRQRTLSCTSLASSGIIWATLAGMHVILRLWDMVGSSSLSVSTSTSGRCTVSLSLLFVFPSASGWYTVMLWSHSVSPSASGRCTVSVSFGRCVCGWLFGVSSLSVLVLLLRLSSSSAASASASGPPASEQSKPQ